MSSESYCLLIWGTLQWLAWPCHHEVLQLFIPFQCLEIDLVEVERCVHPQAFYSCHQMVPRQDLLLVSAGTCEEVWLCSVTLMARNGDSRTGSKAGQWTVKTGPLQKHCQALTGRPYCLTTHAHTCSYRCTCRGQRMTSSALMPDLSSLLHPLRMVSHWN